MVPQSITLIVEDCSYKMSCVLYLEIWMIKSILGCDSLLRVICEEPVEQVKPVLCEKRGWELLPQVIIGLVSKGHLQKGHHIISTNYRAYQAALYWQVHIYKALRRQYVG